jgi:hypothetical protein
VDLAADLGNRLVNRGKGKALDKIRGSPPYLSTPHECGAREGVWWSPPRVGERERSGRKTWGRD